MDKGLAAPQGPIDFIHLAKQTLGDTHLQRELLTIFVEQSPPLLTRLLALGSGENGRLDDLTHRLKGSARAIGAVHVASIAEAIEYSEPGENRQRLLADLGAALEASLAAIALWQEAESASGTALPGG
jgi:HPt (histidine-containing phosphotransfer) domain-containing protein